MSEPERRAGRTRDEVREKLLAIMRENARIDPEALREEARLRDDLSMDSLDLVSVVNEVEHEFKIVIPDKEIEKLATVADVVEALWSRLAVSA
jgi:acyl carrier protein